MNLLLNAFSGVNWIIKKCFLPITEDGVQSEQIWILIPTSRKIKETRFREFKARGLVLSVRNHFQLIETENWKTVAYINLEFIFSSHRSLQEATQGWSGKHVTPLKIRGPSSFYCIISCPFKLESIPQKGKSEGKKQKEFVMESALLQSLLEALIQGKTYTSMAKA